MEQPVLEFAFIITIQVNSTGIMDMGNIEKGTRKIVPIMGGTVEGPVFHGRVVPGGYDWQLIRNDAVAEIEARYVLQADAGDFITIVNKGLRHGPAEVMKRLAAGEEVDATEYYFRSVPVFETSNPQYDWLIKNVFIATGTRKPDKVIITVWKVC